MTLTQIEAWALRVADRVVQGKPHEDSRVELKATWPTDHGRAARQIAALANASRGSPVMWLIGLDQANGVVGAKHQDLANWWPQLVRRFDGVAPAMRDLNIATPQGSDIVALYIETERAPFVVTTGTSPEREVPWRDGTRTRSATRSELLLMLSQVVLVPDIEILRLTLTASTPDGKIEDTQSTVLRWNVRAELYVTPQDNRRISIPMHRCIASAEVGDMRLQQDQVVLPGSGIDNPNIVATYHQLMLDGPARFTVFFNGTGPMKLQTELPDTANVTVDLGLAGAIRPASFSEELERREAQPFQFARWSNRPD